jgi:hypothetical protein
MNDKQEFALARAVFYLLKQAPHAADAVADEHRGTVSRMIDAWPGLAWTEKPRSSAELYNEITNLPRGHWKQDRNENTEK